MLMILQYKHHTLNKTIKAQSRKYFEFYSDDTFQVIGKVEFGTVAKGCGTQPQSKEEDECLMHNRMSNISCMRKSTTCI